MSGSSKCQVKGCGGEALHELPKDVEKRRVWTEALNLEVRYSPKNKVMCPEHFQMLQCIDVSSSKGSLSTTSGGSNDDDDDPLRYVKNKKILLPKQATAFMRSWLSEHLHHPYPTEHEKMKIAAQTDLTFIQVSNWFVNARRRILLPMLDDPNQVSASSKPSLSESLNAAESPHQDVVKAKKRRQSIPAKFKVRRDNVSVASPSLDSTAENTNNGVDNWNAHKFRQKSAAPSAHTNKNSKPKEKTVFKVVVPAASYGHFKYKNHPRTSAPSSSNHQSNGSNGVLTRKAIPKPHAYSGIGAKATSAPGAQVTVRGTALTNGKTSSTAAPLSSSHDSSCSGEDLLDSLYEKLYLKSSKLEEVELEPVRQRLPSAKPSRASKATPVELVETTIVKSCELKNNATQTAPSVHTAVLSYEMYQSKPEWVNYHTGLASYEQFKLVLDSLGLESLDLTYRSPDRTLQVEDQLLMTLLKLRRGEPDLGLAIVFGVAEETVGNIFTTWIDFMYREWSTPDIWPTQELRAFRIFGPNGVRNNQPVLSRNSQIQDKVTETYKILSVEPAQNYRPITDCILFVCCMLCDFRDGVISTRQSCHSMHSNV